MTREPQNHGPDRQAGASGRRDPHRASAAVIAAVTTELDRLLAARPQAELYLVATPIGNLGDVSLRALALLACVDDLYCEDTRTSQKLLSRFAINRRLLSYHEHNAERMRPQIIAALAAGRSVALISDAGTPAISDPGFKLARDVIAAGHNVVAIPGPSAAIAALAASGVATDRFLFAGFLAQKSTARRREIMELAAVPASLVFYESPHRLSAALGDLADLLGDRQGVVAREITKKFEEFKRGHLGDLAAWAAEVPARGEITIIVGPPAPAIADDITDEVIERRLAAARERTSPSRAAKEVAEALGVSRQRVYAIGLAMRQDEAATSNEED
jgi:16S rRNA (cytidine1402-2'-O)-methyltransferase